MANTPVTLTTNQSTQVRKTAAVSTSLYPAGQAPVITGISPSTGGTSGGTSVTISGSGFLGGERAQSNVFYSVHRGALTTSETSSAHVTGGPVHKHTFSITESQTLTLTRAGLIDNVKFPISASQTLLLTKGIVSLKQVRVLQNIFVIPAARTTAKTITIPTITAPLVSGGHLRTLTMTESTTPKIIKNFGHTPVLMESPTIRILHGLLWKFTTTQPNTTVAHSRTNMHRFATAPTTVVIERNNLFPFHINETTSLSLFKRSIFPFFVTQATQAKTKHGLAKAVVIQIKLQPNVNGLVFHQPIKLTNATSTKVTRRTLRSFGYSQSAPIRVDSGQIFRRIVLTQNTVATISGLNIIRFKFPIMGVIYQPVDQYGSLVPVISNLSDYHYWFNTDDPYPSVYWASSDLSSNTTNDQYNPWRTK